MKWEIFHSTRYDYFSAVRDSINSICLQPMPVPEQTVELFILKVLPASRLTHSHDLFSNRISRFEINEPHSSLLIEAQRIRWHLCPQRGNFAPSRKSKRWRTPNPGMTICRPAGL